MTNEEWDHAIHYASLRNALREYRSIIAREHLFQLLDNLWIKEFNEFTELPLI